MGAWRNPDPNKGTGIHIYIPWQNTVEISRNKIILNQQRSVSWFTSLTIYFLIEGLTSGHFVLSCKESHYYLEVIWIATLMWGQKPRKTFPVKCTLSSVIEENKYTGQPLSIDKLLEMETLWCQQVHNPVWKGKKSFYNNKSSSSSLRHSSSLSCAFSPPFYSSEKSCLIEMPLIHPKGSFFLGENLW